MIPLALFERSGVLRPAGLLVALVAASVFLGSPLVALAQGDVGSDVDSAAWLSGCWVTSAGGVRSEEVWMAPAGGLMVGMGRNVRGDVATGYEFLLLQRKEGRLTYSAYPSGQDPADFPATEVSTRRLRFENAQHDFPQAIEYERTSPDSLTAKVYGEVGSAEPAFVLRFARRSCSP
jgi:hypothetical protein